MLIGVFPIAALGGSSGRDLGTNASGTAFANAALLLVAAELLKVALGACQAMQIRWAAQVQEKWRAGSVLSGYAGAALITASGLLGIYAVFAESRGLGASASALAFASAGATAIWVIAFVNSTNFLNPWHRIVGLIFAATSLLSVLIAPIAMLAGLLGLAWWFGLSRTFSSLQVRI
jgi:hypothetical protein